MIVFEDMIADILSNKKLNPIVPELFIRGIKLNTSLVFITQFSFAWPKSIRLNSASYFIMKIPNKRKLQQIAIIIHQILTLETLLIITEYVLKKHILFW